MTLDEKVKKLLAAGPLTVLLVVGAESDGLWVAVKLADGQRFGGRSFTEAVELAFRLRERTERRSSAAELWRARRDSNSRPSGPQPDALSTELRAPIGVPVSRHGDLRGLSALGGAHEPEDCGGEGGIRTLDAGYPTWRFSKPLH
jgi:hypothetical protein